MGIRKLQKQESVDVMDRNNHKKCNIQEREKLMSDMAIMSLIEFMESYDCSEKEYWMIFRRFKTKDLVACLRESIRQVVSYRGSISEELYDFTVSKFKKRIVTLLMLDMGYDEDMCIYLDDNAVC